MLTGLLDVTSGTARLLGKPIDTTDMRTRMRVGICPSPSRCTRN
jgi:ribosome-dependent ATPase